MTPTNTVIKLLCLSILMVMTLAMDSPANEFGAQDLVNLGVFSKSSGSFKSSKKGAKSFGGVKRGPSPTSFGRTKKEEAFLFAIAKVSGGRHGSNPFITIDIEERTASCGPYDWVFKPNCKAPEVNRKIYSTRVAEVRHAFLHVFKLPSGWKNPRVTLPRYGLCGATRTAAMRTGSSAKLCLQADFRYRKCSKIIFKFRCRWRSCPSMNLLVRYIAHGSGDTTVPYIATENEIFFCKNPTANLFLK